MRRFAKFLAAPALAAGLGLATVPATASAAPAAPPGRCLSQQLTLTAQYEGGAAGTTGIWILYTNNGTTCTLRGYPGVSALGTAGRTLGSPAGRDPVYPVTTQLLKHGWSVMSLILLGDVYNYPAAQCQPAKGAAFRVYPPGAYNADTAAYTFEACRKPGIVYMHTTAVFKTP